MIEDQSEPQGPYRWELVAALTLRVPRTSVGRTFRTLSQMNERLKQHPMRNNDRVGHIEVLQPIFADATETWHVHVHADADVFHRFLIGSTRDGAAFLDELLSALPDEVDVDLPTPVLLRRASL